MATYSQADKVVTNLIDAIINEQIAKGLSESNARSYALGYIGSQFATILSFMSKDSAARAIDSLENVTNAKIANAKAAQI